MHSKKKQKVSSKKSKIPEYMTRQYSEEVKEAVKRQIEQLPF